MYKLFPFIEKKNMNKLLIDEESKHYITTRVPAERITNIISLHVEQLGININNIIITDCTAGVGGNTISFAKKFKHIHAIEIIETRCNQLYNNIKLYELDNVDINNNDCLKVLPIISDHDVIYIDPPWGGTNYKYENKIDIEISNVSLNDICKMIFNKEIMKRIPYFIVIKLPKNFNFESLLFKYVKYELKKMFIIVIF